MINKKHILQKVEQNANKVRSLGVIKLILIGSYARDQQHKDSDIDFIVQFEKGRGLFDDFVGLLHLLEDLFHKKIDLAEMNLIKEELKPSILGGKKIEAKI